MLLLLARLAFAAPSPLEQIEADVGRGASAAVACTSSQDGGRRLAQVLTLADAMGADAASDAWSGAAALSERLAFSASPLHGVTWGGEQGFVLELGSSAGGSQVVEAIARTTGTNGVPAPVSIDGAGWVVAPPDGSALRVQPAGDGYRIEQGTPPGATGRTLPAALREATPDGPGCLLYTHGESARTGEYHALVHLPPQGSPGPVHLTLTMTTLSALDAIAFRAGSATPVRTVEVPTGVAVFGLGLDGLDPDVLLDTPEQRRAVRRLARAFPWSAGTTVAVFRPAEDGRTRVGAAVPLGKEWRPSKVLRRFLKVARAGGAQVLPIDATHAQLLVTQGRRTVTLHVAGATGRLLVASDPVLLTTMEGDTGAPWITGVPAETAQRYPILLAGTQTGTLGEAPRPWSVAVDFPPSTMTAQILLPLEFEQVNAAVAAFGGVFRASFERIKGALPQGDAPPATALP